MVESKVAKKPTAKTPAKKTVPAKKSSEPKKEVKITKKIMVKTPTIPVSAKISADKKTPTNKGDKYIPAIGKRKTARASIRMHTNGTGLITINGKSLNEYFATAYQRKVVEQPLKHTSLKNMDFSILVKGGGKTGQADACRLGIAKILIKSDPELRPLMRAQGWVTRDSRKKERKKPGLKRARRSPQWSKR